MLLSFVVYLFLGRSFEGSAILQVQFMLGAFGGAYKRNPAIKANGRCQDLIQGGHGLQECNELLEEIQKVFNPGFSPVAETMEKYLQNVLQASCLFGLESFNYAISCMPNGLASLRLLCSGEILWVRAETRQLHAAMKMILAKDDVGGIDGVAAYMKGLEAAGVEKLMDHGCKIMCCKQTPGQVLYIPVGWMCGEFCTKGVLIYGLRKTLIYASNHAQANYEALTSLYAECKRPVDKMKATGTFVSPPEPE